MRPGVKCVEFEVVFYNCMEVEFTYHKINYFKENHSVVSGAFTMLYNHHLYLQPRYLPPKETLNPLSSHSPSPPPPSPSPWHLSVRGA